MTETERQKLIEIICDVCVDTFAISEQSKTRQEFAKDCIKQTIGTKTTLAENYWTNAELKLWFILNVSNGQAYLDNKGLL